MGKLKIIVLYDRVLVDEEEPAASTDKSPVTRTLDKKEVEEEVAEALAEDDGRGRSLSSDERTRARHRDARRVGSSRQNGSNRFAASE